MLYWRAWNISRLTLEDLNDLEVERSVPAIVFIVSAMVAGVMGNTSVIYVFSCKLRRSSNYRYFVLALAMYDLAACVVAMPVTIACLLHAYTYTSRWMCKLTSFGYHYISCGSALAHLLMGIERYKKICRPLSRQMTVSEAKLFVSVIVLVFAVIAALPAGILYGHTSIEFGIQNITGVGCFTDDSYRDTAWPTVYSLFLLIGVVVTTTSLVVLYCLIVRRVWQHETLLRSTSSARCARANHPADDTASEGPFPPQSGVWLTSLRRIATIRVTPFQQPVQPANNLSDIATSSRCLPGGRSSKSRREAPAFYSQSLKERQTQRVTIITFLVTLVFLLSYVPYLSLRLLLYAREDLMRNLSHSKEILFQIGMKSYILNNVLNPLVYYIMDKTFRRDFHRSCYNCLKPNKLNKPRGFVWR